MHRITLTVILQFKKLCVCERRKEELGIIRRVGDFSFSPNRFFKNLRTIVYIYNFRPNFQLKQERVHRTLGEGTKRNTITLHSPPLAPETLRHKS